jgi:hypothetical protein
MSEWHTVRFVDEPEPPHINGHRGRSIERWPNVRGREVPIRQMFTREQVTKMAGPPQCECDQFFEISIEGGLSIVCRRLLEMD